MAKLSISEMERVLRENGYDTSNFTIRLKDVEVEVSQDVNKAVEDVQLKHYSFRRWVMAQTMRMLNNENGWDGALREKDYMYQFKMIEDEYKALVKMEKENSPELEERAKFFTHDVVVSTYNHYLNQLTKYIKKNRYTKTKVFINADGDRVTTETELVKLKVFKKAGLSEVKVSDFARRLHWACGDIGNAIGCLECYDTYQDLYELIKGINSNLIQLPKETPKCPEWKQAFRGAGAYYTLQNMISYHGVRMFYGSIDNNLGFLKQELMRNQNEVWKLHYIMLDVIERNGFDTHKKLG